jgi:hypothetical protein
MPAPRFSRNHILDILKIAALPEDKLLQVKEAISSSKKRILTDDSIKVIVESVTNDSVYSELFPDIVFSLIVISKSTGLELLAVFDELERAAAASEFPLEDWNKNKETLLAIASDERVVLGEKAVELLHASPNIYRGSSVIIDSRPIFDHGREKVVGHIIFATLVASFHTTKGVEEIAIALDVKDLRDLRESSERALKKIKHLRASLERTDNDWEVYVPGSSGNEK